MSVHPDTLDRQTVYDLLSSASREHLLSCLSALESVPPDDAARRIAARERGTSRAAVSDDAATAARISLEHAHLPRLTQHDVVEYRPPDGAIEPGPNFDDLEPFVAPLDPAIE
ncbi:hypothetical protein ACFQGT_05450 [Natrialbaceae archaeon GCM10025810]|uniref:DUF7344 domain-containing protein n=1 Tax=Halovalidus salilacus TaxID=3075124 RepID=UPI00360CFD4C